MEKKQFCLLLISVDYTLIDGTVISKKLKRRRFKYNIQDEVFSIFYNKEWHKANQNDFRID